MRDMPQPLSRVRRNARLIVTPAALSHRPELAALAMQVIAQWADIDGDFAGILSLMLKTDVAVGTAMYLALVGGGTRRAALAAAAGKALAPADLELFYGVERAIKPSRDRRNEFAHHAWAYADELPDALLLLPAELVTWANVGARQHVIDTAIPFEVQDGVVRKVLQLPPARHLDRSRIMVFKHADFERDVLLAGEASHLVYLLWQVLGEGPYADSSRNDLAGRLGMTGSSVAS